jgi:putative addiction module component (TIGR02574 family)
MHCPLLHRLNENALGLFADTQKQGYNPSMARSFEEVRQLALELPYEDRAKLSQLVWESLHPPGEDLPQQEIDAAWEVEIERRVAEIHSGKAVMIPWEQVESELRAKLSPKAQTRRRA